MIEFLLINSNKIILRKASKDDEDDILFWRNDPVTVSFTPTKKTISQEDHKKWYKKQLKDPNSWLLIPTLDNEKVGMVRFDFVDYYLDNYYEISINLNPKFRGKNLSSIVIDLGIEYLMNVENIIYPIFAKIHNENIPSIKTFKKSNFEKYEVNYNDSYIKDQVQTGWSYYILWVEKNY